MQSQIAPELQAPKICILPLHERFGLRHSARRFWLSEQRELLIHAVNQITVIGALLATAAIVLWWYGNRPPRNDADARERLARLRPSGGELNLIVVTLDTTRADRLGCYGFRPDVTPNIDALAREAIVFDHATATVPLTFPSPSEAARHAAGGAGRWWPGLTSRAKPHTRAG